MPRKLYDHARYAANQGDVWKHWSLVRVLSDLAVAGQPFHYAETHAGPGESQLAPGGEWERGLGRLEEQTFTADFATDDFYLALATARRRAGASYLGSWRWAAALLDSRGCLPNLSLCELSAPVCDLARAATLRAGAEARRAPLSIDLRAEDGFDADLSGADFLLVDPPYTQVATKPHDWVRTHALVEQLKARGTAFLVWYPVFWITNPQRLVDATGLPGFELLWADFTGRPGYASKGAGLLAGGAAALLEGCVAELATLAARLGGRLNRRFPRV